MSSHDVTINSDGWRRGLFGNIRTRLIFSFSLTFAAVLIIHESVDILGIPFTDDTGRQGHERSRAFQSLNLIADLKKERLQGWLEERRGDAHLASDSDMVEANVTVLRAAISKLVATGQESDLWASVRKEKSYLALREFMDVIITSYGVYQRLFIADAETGIIFVSTDGALLGSDVSRHPSFTGVLRSRNDYVSDIEFDPESGRSILRISHVIEDIDVNTLEDKEGQVIAVLVLEIDAEEILVPMLHTGDGLGKTGEALLINEDVRIVASLKHPLADGTRARPLEYQNRAIAAVLATQGQEGIIESEDYRGEPVLAAYRYIPVTPEWGWGMVVKRDRAELFAPMRRETTQSVVLGLAGILAVVVLTALLAKALTRPILALSRTAKQVSDGDLTARASVTGSDEVAGLATTFNAMLHRIQNWHTELEEQVELRTAELRTRISEREQAENELRKLSVAVEQSPATVVITDTEGTIQYVNPMFTKTTGYTAEEAIGQNPRVLNSGEMTRDEYKELWDTIVAGKTWRGDFHNKKKSGELYWEATSISPIRNSEGAITHFLAVKEDITERKRAEGELRQAREAADAANKAKSEFLANMSHEIRTPMAAILGFAENMLDADQPESERLNCIHTIRRNGDYLLGLINDILDLSKIEAGKMSIERGGCQPCRIVAEVASLMRMRADAKGLSFNIEYIGGIPETIRSNSTRLRQILINLIGNAIKFTDVGAVRLVTRFVNDTGEPRLQFDVIDTGRGMTEEQVTKLFRPFMQADASTMRKHGGTGLGLTISKRFAELLGGDIAVVETEVGGGTTVRATVATGPLEGVRMLEDPMSVTLVAHAAHTGTRIERSALEGCHILLAEDGADSQRLISSFLKKAGADVTVEENGKLAVEKALAAMNRRRDGDPERPVDIILMDMQMPVMDGYEATSLLRQKGYTAPIIALTAHAMATDREKCINAGCDDYASKPINRTKLIEMIQQHLVPAEAASPVAT